MVNATHLGPQAVLLDRLFLVSDVSARSRIVTAEGPSPASKHPLLAGTLNLAGYAHVVARLAHAGLLHFVRWVTRLIYAQKPHANTGLLGLRTRRGARNQMRTPALRSIHPAVMSATADQPESNTSEWPRSAMDRYSVCVCVE